MSYHYSSSTREASKYALPNIEVWRDRIAEVVCPCGTYEVPADHIEHGMDCPSGCGRVVGGESDDDAVVTDQYAWFYWFCFPGCMPDGSVMGPFASEAEALEDARDGIDDDDDA